MLASPSKDALVILLVVLLFFGPKRLPALSRSIGESLREFKGGVEESVRSSEAPGDEEPELLARSSEAEPTGVNLEHTNA